MRNLYDIEIFEHRVEISEQEMTRRQTVVADRRLCIYMSAKRQRHMPHRLVSGKCQQENRRSLNLAVLFGHSCLLTHKTHEMQTQTANSSSQLVELEPALMSLICRCQ